MNGNAASALITTTVSGAEIDLDNPDPASIRLNDIATQLSRLCRYAGATIGHYSVAQHSVLVAQECTRAKCEPITALYALFHDAHEIYIGDVVLPLEQRLSKTARDEIEMFRNRLDRAIFYAFGLVHPMPAKIAAEMWMHHAKVVAAECRDARAGSAAQRDLKTAEARGSLPINRRINLLAPDSAEKLWHQYAIAYATAAGVESRGPAWGNA